MDALKNLKESIDEKTTVSRRSFLKGLGALSATAALYGCGGGGQSSYSTAPAVGTAIASPADNLVIDPELTTVMVSHPYNCGGRCLFKVWVKNGVMKKITSGVSDIPRSSAQIAADESINLPQFRGCMRGYAQIKSTYAPDRLKTPMIQTIARGNLRGFVSIPWEQAYDTIAGWYQTEMARQKVLGYLPVMDSFFSGAISNYLGISVSLTGAPSVDNMQQGLYGAVGPLGYLNPNGLGDMLNSKFILNIGCNAAVSFSHHYPIHWYLTKAKEAGIPIVTLDPLTTDTVSPISTGYPQYNLPPHINPREGTDTAILVAMATYIYANNLHNAAFIKQYCFGFYPGDTVVSQSPMASPLTGKAYAGQTFTTPNGMSFVEYITGLMTTYGGVNGVLNWASGISGVPATTIQNLAIAYATTKPSCLFSGWGASRTGAGMWFVWMTIALAAMTGQTILKGGGPGFQLDPDPTPVNLGNTTQPITTAASYGTISASWNPVSKVILQGTDNRTPAQLRADILAQNGIDLGAWTTTRNDTAGHDGRLRIEMIGWSYANSVNQRSSIAAHLQALANVKYIYGIDLFVTPSMAYSDIILPQTCHHEYNSFQSKSQVFYCSNKVIPAMYECTDTGVIAAEILNRLGVKYGKYGPQGSATDAQLMAQQWAGATIAPALLAINPGSTLPSFATFQQQGIFQLPLPIADAVNIAQPGVASLPPGNYFTETGRINFFSPFYFYRDQALGSAYQHADGGYYRCLYPPKAMWAPPVEGFNATTGAFLGYYTGQKVMVSTGKSAVYTLQVSTAHHRRRAHSVYDNVAVLQEDFPEVITMNPADAAARGISNGDYVYVYNDWGCIQQNVAVSKRITQGLIHIGDGQWFRASMSLTYQAWFDADGNGVKMHTVPVDVGGAPNTVMHNRDIGVKDSFCETAGDNCWGGHFVEVSLTHPDQS